MTEQADRLAQPDAAVEAVVVTVDELLLRRVRDALRRGGIGVADIAADVAELRAAARAPAAIVLAGYATAAAQRLPLRAARTRFPGVPCVLVASLSSNGVHKALDAGASGVVLEADVERALAPTIRAVCVDQVVIPQRVRQAIRSPLSHREKETLALMAAGMTNRQIAGKLYLAESTVKTHLSSIFAKLGVMSRAEATALVLDPESNLGLSVVALPHALGTRR